MEKIRLMAQVLFSVLKEAGHYKRMSLYVADLCYNTHPPEEPHWPYLSEN
jgi:hypothetical protein